MPPLCRDHDDGRGGFAISRPHSHNNADPQAQKSCVHQWDVACASLSTPRKCIQATHHVQFDARRSVFMQRLSLSNLHTLYYLYWMLIHYSWNASFQHRFVEIKTKCGNWYAKMSVDKLFHCIRGTRFEDWFSKSYIYILVNIFVEDWF